jgi:hypothetical protein
LLRKELNYYGKVPKIRSYPEYVKLFIHHGYVPTYYDVVRCANFRLEIDDYDNYDFNDDGRLLSICVGKPLTRGPNDIPKFVIKKFRPKYFSKLKSGAYYKMITKYTTVSDIRIFVKKVLF